MREITHIKINGKRNPLEGKNAYEIAKELGHPHTDTVEEWLASLIGQPTDEQTEDAVQKWLNDHPDATTTVQDESLGVSKLTKEARLHLVKDYATPQMFGAKGDGVTDDTLAFQNCIDNNDTVLVPIGRYKITNALRLTGRKNIIGANRYDCKIYCVGCGGIVFENNAEVGVIKSLQFIGDHSENNCITFALNSAMWTFDDLWIHHFGGACFYGTQTGHVNNIVIQNSFLRDGNKGIELVGSSASQVNAIYISGTNITGFTTTGLELWGTAISVVGCAIQACEYGIVFDASKAGDNTGGCTGVLISGNYFEKCHTNVIKVFAKKKGTVPCCLTGLSINGNFSSYAYKDNLSEEDKALYDTIPQIVFDTDYTAYLLSDTKKVISDVSITGNSFSDNKKGLLMDLNNLLGDECIISCGKSGGLGATDCTILNSGSATVLNRLEKKYVTMATSQIITGDYSIQNGNVTVAKGKSAWLDFENKHYKYLKIPINTATAGNLTLQVRFRCEDDDTQELKGTYNTTVALTEGDNTAGVNLLYLLPSDIAPRKISSFRVLLIPRADAITIGNVNMNT